MCMECYFDENRITPLLNPLDCLANHTQYICGTCGRCICIEHDPECGLQRWNFPFKSLEIATLYLRTADYSMKRPFPFLSLADIAFKEFRFFKDMNKLPELHIRQLVIIDTQPLAVKRSLFFKRASLEICNIL